MQILNSEDGNLRISSLFEDDTHLGGTLSLPFPFASAGNVDASLNSVSFAKNHLLDLPLTGSDSVCLPSLSPSFSSIVRYSQPFSHPQLNNVFPISSGQDELISQAGKDSLPLLVHSHTTIGKSDDPPP